jgi:hypothetical protein
VRDLRQLINLKKIITGEKRGMDDTCAMENISNILMKLNLKCELGKLVGLKTL